MATLEISVREDLARVDKAMTRILTNEDHWKKFVRDPNGALIDVGLHVPTGEAINRRCNAIMFATLCNRPLLDLTRKTADGFLRSIKGTAKAGRWSRRYEGGLDRGALDNDVDYDMAYVDYVLKDSASLRKRLRLAFDDLNGRKLLSKSYDRKQLYAYIDATIEAAKRYRQDVQLPVLEEWDAHYGVGKGFGVALAEVAFDFTAIVGVEVAVAVTVIGIVSRKDLAVNPGDVFFDQRHQRSAVVGQLLKLASELFVSAQSFKM